VEESWGHDRPAEEHVDKGGNQQLSTRQDGSAGAPCNNEVTDEPCDEQEDQKCGASMEDPGSVNAPEAGCDDSENLATVVCLDIVADTDTGEDKQSASVCGQCLEVEGRGATSDFATSFVSGDVAEPIQASP
jgi:hypothetical protein